MNLQSSATNDTRLQILAPSDGVFRSLEMVPARHKNARPLPRCRLLSVNSRESVSGANARRWVRSNRDRVHGVSQRICEACDWHCRVTQDCTWENRESFAPFVRQVPVATFRLLFGEHPRRRRTLRASAWRDNHKFVWRLLLSLRLVFLRGGFLLHAQLLFRLHVFVDLQGFFSERVLRNFGQG